MKSLQPDKPVEPGSSILWAWWDAERKAYRHVYPSELCVRMCSPDGYKTEEAEGRGLVVQVRVAPATEGRVENIATP